MDLNEYYKMFFSNNSLIGLEGTKAIFSAIEYEDLDLVKSLIHTYEHLEDFKQGYNLQYIFYGKAVLSALWDRDHNTSFEYCLKGILIECQDFDINNIKVNTYSNIGMALIHCMGQNYFDLNQYNEGKKILKDLLTVIETYEIYPSYPMFEASPYVKKLYQFVLYHLSIHFFHHDDKVAAKKYVDKGIALNIF